MNDSNRKRIEQVLLAAVGAAIPVAIAAWQLPQWLAAHPEVREIVTAACRAALGEG